MRKSNMMKKEMEVHETEIVASSVDQTKSECSSSIYQNLHSLEMEANKRLSPSYMDRVQNDISPNMREILVDWLVEVAKEYQLATDTPYLTVSYLDRFFDEDQGTSGFNFDQGTSVPDFFTRTKELQILS